MTRLRALVGPAIVGIAMWCAAGDLTVATQGTADVRLVVPAPWWWLVVSLVLAAAVRPWREKPVLATPALLTTLPWWPVPVPAVALIWTGPTGWLPIGLALFAAGAARSGEPRAFRPGAVFAGALTLVAALLTFWSVQPRLPGGDEPAYLVITQSLLADRDLRIENNHAQRDYAAYFGGNLRPDFIQRGRDGQIYSIHAPGASAVVLPAFALFGYNGAVATIALLAALTGSLIWAIGLMATGDRTAAWIAWAAVTLSTTFLIQSVTIFPDGPGALVVAAGTWLLLAMRLAPDRITTTRIVIVSAMFAAMPWLHTRFSVLAAGFGALIAWQIVTDASRPMPQRLRRAIAFGVVPAVSAGLWFLFFQLIYGTPNPSAPYGPDPGTRLAYVPGGLLGLAFDQRFGLLIASPALALAAFGLFLPSRKDVSLVRAVGVARLTALVAVAYAAATATYWMWWGGQPVTPARFLAAALPVLAAPLAIAWARSSSVMRVWTALLLALSLAMTVALIGVDRGDLAWNVRDTAARWLEWAGPVANLARAWPSFFWVLRPEDLRTEWPFAIHAAVWLIVFVVAIGAVAWAARSRGWGRQAVAAAVVWTFLVALMINVSIGWRLTGEPSLDPTRSQLALLRAMASGARVSRVAAGSVRRVAGPSEIAIDVQRRGQVFVRASEWALLTGVPAGEYDLRIAKPASVAGDVAIRIGRGPHPFRTIPLGMASEVNVPLTLAGGARGLVLEPAPSLAAAEGRVELRPRALFADPREPALVAVPYGSLDVFFLDDGAFVEGDGFWIRGGRAGEFVLSDQNNRSAIDLELTNGATANTVKISTATSAETIALAPHEARVIGIPLALRRARVRVEASAGFRPSDADGSTDRRFLGVRVVVK